MKKRVFALLLALGLLLTPASALTVEQAREILSDYYIDAIPAQVLAQPTIEEILAALGDPYTTYYDAQEYEDFLGTMEDTELVGIGIRAYYLAEGVLLTQVAPDSPASEGGLREEDYIIAVDGHDTRGAADADIDSWIRGEEGSSVELTVLRGEETFAVTLKRRAVVFPTVILEKIENQVGWISCSAFGSATFQYFYDIIAAHDHEVQGWVVDLRGNGGGNVLTALFSAGCFAGWGQGVYLRNLEGDYTAYRNGPDLITASGYYKGDLSAFDEKGYLTQSPVYVLTDEGTASAAELFCAIVRDAGAGLVIGGRTYGKGVAQTLFSQEDGPSRLRKYFAEGDALKVTTERAFSEGGATTDKVGVLPHFLVEADLADEAAALLAAPVSEEEDALFFRDLSTTSDLVDDMVMPLSLLRAPENAGAAAQLLSALPATAWCMLRTDGELYQAALEEAARACGVTLETRAFSDLAETPFAEEIDTLGVYGLVSGPGDGTFRPLDTLDRASLCAMLVKALRYPAAEGVTVFSDVPVDAWYAPYVSALYEMGVLDNPEDGLFHPHETVSHEQLLVILGRTAQWLSMDSYERMLPDGWYGDMVPDAEVLAERYPEYSDWARELVWLCDTTKIWYKADYLAAQAPTTRDEAALAVYQLLHNSGVLPA